jgi:hypothetical protein
MIAILLFNSQNSDPCTCATGVNFRLIGGAEVCDLPLQTSHWQPEAFAAIMAMSSWTGSWSSYAPW